MSEESHVVRITVYCCLRITNCCHEYFIKASVKSKAWWGCFIPFNEVRMEMTYIFYFQSFDWRGHLESLPFQVVQMSAQESINFKSFFYLSIALLKAARLYCIQFPNLFVISIQERYSGQSSFKPLSKLRELHVFRARRCPEVYLTK